jgi:hypothetical protein
MVRVTATKTMERVLELIDKLDDYPVLDEEDWASREYEQACSAYDAWARYEVAKMAEERGIKILLDEDGCYDPKPEDEEVVRGLVADAIMDYDPAEGCYSDSHLSDLLRESFPDVKPDELTLTFDF